MVHCLTVITSLSQQLQRDEGVRLRAYTDTTGNITIGVGRNLSTTGISLAEAETLLSNDIQRTTIGLEKSLSWFSSLDNVRRGVLLNMAFNIGVEGLLEFKQFLGYIEAGNWQAAANDMLSTAWAREVGDRAMRLATQLTSGEWQ